MIYVPLGTMTSNEDTPAICVVTPVLNGEKFIAETIESVLSQTFLQWEYYIMDGGSSDSTIEIASGYAKKDHRIRVITEPDQGMYDAIFKGFEKSHAPVCYWINSDDKLMPWAFESVLNYITLKKIDWVTGMNAFWNENGLLHCVEPTAWYPRQLIRFGLVHGRCLGWIQQESVFFTKKLLSRIDPSSLEQIRRQKLAGDFLLWTQFAKFSSLHFLPTVLSGFRIHSENATQDINAYYGEIAKAGFPMPPQVLGAVLKKVYRFFSLMCGYVLLARWQGWINAHK